MKTYGLLSAGNVQLHFIAVSPAAVPSPVSSTASLISFAGWEGFFGERALAQPMERCGCKGNFIAAISAFAELKDMPSSSARPRPPRQLECCIAGDRRSRQSRQRRQRRLSSSPELSRRGRPGWSVCGTARSASLGCIYVRCLHCVRFNKAPLIYPRSGQMLSHYYRRNIAQVLCRASSGLWGCIKLTLMLYCSINSSPPCREAIINQTMHDT